MSEKQALEIQNKRVEYDNIIYLINEEENTAGVIGYKRIKDKIIIIPRSIKEESKEYYVTSILENAFEMSYITSVQFPSDSKLHKICKDAFSRSTIKSITIPSELVELEEGWCDCTSKLTKIEVSPKNQRYSCYENKMIIGKTKIDQDNHDCLIFCVRDIQNIKIPSFIEHIYSYSFDHCKQLEKIEIPNDSKLQTINKKAFSFSTIKSITIPSELIELKEGWCDCTSKLTKIEVSPKNQRYCCFNEKLIIGKTNIDESNYNCLVFCVRDIKNIKIPNFIEHICSYSFKHCKQLEKIEIPSDSKLQTINKEAFSFATIKDITIPSSVNLIGEGSFANCKQLEQIVIPDDSKLEVIDKNSFSYSMIKSITIPSSVTLIGEGAFSDCRQLEQIVIPDDSKLQMIDKNAFSFTSINSIKIPSKLVELEEGWCDYTSKLTKIDVSPLNPRYCCYEDKMIIGKTNIDQDNYDCLVFCVRDIQHIKIPNFIEHICSCSFYFCEQLEKIEIPSDSKLQTINKDAFSYSTIKNIYIPSSVTFIGECSFSNCDKLEQIEIPNDSKLQMIDNCAFSNSAIKSIKIPSSVTLIGEGAFGECGQLEQVEFAIDSKLQTIDKYAFYLSSIHSIAIPSSVTQIEEGAFGECKRLQIIEINNEEVISMYQSVFINCKNALLMVQFHF